LTGCTMDRRSAAARRYNARPALIGGAFFCVYILRPQLLLDKFVKP